MEEPRYYVEQQDEELTPHRILDETPNWWITEKGMIGKRTEDDPGGYEIVRRRVAEAGWIAHMADKAQVDPLEFVEAFYRARSLYGVGTLERTVEVTLPLYHLEEPQGYSDVDLKALLDEEGSPDRLASVPTARVRVDPESAERVLDYHGEFNRAEPRV